LRYVIRIAGLNDAEDIAQDIFNKVNRGIEGYQGKSKLSNWIYRIATNTVIDRSRSAAYKHATESISINGKDNLDAHVEVEDQKAPSTDQIVIKKEMRDCINEYIEKLPPDYKIVIILSELEGKSNKEIAEILDISLSNAKIRLHRARTLLREVLNEACEFYYTEQNTLACDRRQVKILPKILK
jgi:RNA polymerase sigma-70 factor (ECF subfamily)